MDFIIIIMYGLKISIDSIKQMGLQNNQCIDVNIVYQLDFYQKKNYLIILSNVKLIIYY